MKNKKSKYDIYDDKEDAFLSGYSEGIQDTIETLVFFDVFNKDFLFGRVWNFVTTYKNSIKKHEHY